LPAVVFAAIAAGLLIPAMVAPALLRGPNRAWRAFAHTLGGINGRILLSVLFIIVVTPVAWIRWALGVDPLRRRRRPGVSGWTPYAPRLADAKHYERMY